MSLETAVTILFLFGIAVAPTVTGKRKYRFLAGTVVAVLISIVLGNLLLLAGFGVGAVSGAIWRAA